jgi:hypothetical protein
MSMLLHEALTAGGAAHEIWSWSSYSKLSAGVIGEVPAGVVTRTGMTPRLAAGATAVMEVDEVMVPDVAGCRPKLTVESGEKPVPVIVTTVPPPELPVPGETAVTAGDP